MDIPTGPIGSVPRQSALIEAMRVHGRDAAGRVHHMPQLTLGPLRHCKTALASQPLEARA